MTRINRWLFVICVAGAWWAAAGMQPNPATAAERRMLWQSRDQFVALEQQDGETTGPALPNEHPATITGEQLATLLAALQLKATESAAPEPLFTRETQETLVAQLLPGLRQATPTDDLTFAVIGLHEALFGLAKEPRVTTGRLFVRDGRLNIIVGLAQQGVNEYADRRLAPFTPGSRREAAAGKWQLQVPQQPAGYNLIRKDWVRADTNWHPPIAAAPAAATTTSPAGQPAPALNQPVQSRSPAERLIILKELHDKGLITDEEYRAKRLQIMNEL